MIDFVKNSICSIRTVLNSNKKSGIWLLYGDEGVGKSTIATQYDKNQKDTLTFRCNNEFDLAYAILKNKIQDDYNRHIHLYEPLIKQVKDERIHTIIFDIDGNTNIDYFDLINSIYYMINQQDYFLNIIIFIDSKIYYYYQDSFSKYSTLIYLPPLKKWEYTDFFQLWIELYGNDKIDSQIIKTISAYSIGNAGIFLQHLHMLKFYNILIIENGFWVFKDYCDIEKILKEKFSDIVRKKYERLEPELQTVIKQTSTIGYIFQKKDLKEVFNVENATMILKQIEILTELLYFTDLELENGKFDSEKVQIQIEKMIDSKQAKIWCLALAEYYENKIINTKFISIERCILKEKCIAYYMKANNVSKTIFHSISLIPLLTYLNQFYRAIDLSKTLSDITNDYKEYESVHSYSIYMLAILNKAIGNYNEGLDYIEYYISLFQEVPIYTKYLYSELLYGIGDTSTSYKILLELYKNIIRIDDPNLKLKIVSMLSSIEETLNSKKYIQHFNEALAIAKKNNIVQAYYKLLRKANIAYSGINGIQLMKNAENYFKDNNLILEHIMVQHNIGTESLFYEPTYKSSHPILLSAYNKSLKIGFPLTYIKNSLAIYFILENKYEYALGILESLLALPQEDFSLLALLMNKITCLRKLNLIPKALECLSKAKELNSKEKNKFSFFNAQILLQTAYINLENKNYDYAYFKLIEYIEFEFEDRDTSIISAKVVLKSLCETQKLVSPPFLRHFMEDYDKIVYQMAFNHLVLSDLMFWE